MVRYADSPTTQAEVHIAAPPGAVWPLVSDIALPARLSTELMATMWIDGATGPCAGARFRGRSQHAVVGTWETVSTVVTCDEPRSFRWVVGDPDQPGGPVGFRDRGRRRRHPPAAMGHARAGPVRPDPRHRGDAR